MTILFGLVPQILQASLINDTFSTWLGVEDSNLNLICLGAGLWLARHSPGNCSIHFLQQNSAVENAHLRRLTKVTKLQLRRRGLLKKRNRELSCTSMPSITIQATIFRTLCSKWRFFSKCQHLFSV